MDFVYENLVFKNGFRPSKTLTLNALETFYAA